MSYFSELRPQARRYVSAVVLLGLCAVLYSALSLVFQPISDPKFYIIALLTFVTGSVTVRLPTTAATVSVSETFVFLSLLLFGPTAGTVIVALDVLIISLWLQRRRAQPSYRTLFNAAAPSLSIWLSAQVFFNLASLPPSGLASVPPGSLDLGSLSGFLLPLLAFTVLYFLLNSWLVAWAIALESEARAASVWRRSFLPLILNFFSGASIAALVAAFTLSYNLWALAIIIPPLALTYVTSRHARTRIEEATRHLSELHALYLSTIETLAMAIDAGDQVTHGHIRRVQIAALALAEEMVLRDSRLVKAIQAAALLHDIGKLAVPEYILNKPGRLTPAEFESMKGHAAKGAEILSAIDFPYPVIPIVRHHHENWDGSGYPDGLAGTEIPIGARILAVVDCYDALTSDRPYRPALTHKEALDIILQRRGTMYDPLVTDAFLRVVDRVPAASTPTRPDAPCIDAVASVAAPPTDSALRDIGSANEEMLALFDLATALLSGATLADTSQVLANRLLHVLPASVVVLYRTDDSGQSLVPVHVAGPLTRPVDSIRFGERLSGWVAAHRATITNGNPRLDLGDAVTTTPAPLLSTMSTPLVEDDGLVGVLSVHSTLPAPFDDDHRRFLEGAASLVARVVHHAVHYERTESTEMRDAVTGLPNRRRLARLTGPTHGPKDALPGQTVLLLVEVSDLRDFEVAFGSDARDNALVCVASLLRNSLRVSDMLFRYDEDAFAVLLVGASTDAAEAIAERIRDKADSELGITLGAAGSRLELTIALASRPHDADTLAGLVDVAAHRLQESGHESGDVGNVH